MKKSVCYGILTAAAVAMYAVRHPNQQQVYSLNIVSYVNVGVQPSGISSASVDNFHSWSVDWQGYAAGFNQYQTPDNSATTDRSLYTDIYFINFNKTVRGPVGLVVVAAISMLGALGSLGFGVLSVISGDCYQPVPIK
jgi:hypothetical protein